MEANLGFQGLRAAIATLVPAPPLSPLTRVVVVTAALPGNHLGRVEHLRLAVVGGIGRVEQAAVIILAAGKKKQKIWNL